MRLRPHMQQPTGRPLGRHFGNAVAQIQSHHSRTCRPGLHQVGMPLPSLWHSTLHRPRTPPPLSAAAPTASPDVDSERIACVLQSQSSATIQAWLGKSEGVELTSSVMYAPSDDVIGGVSVSTCLAAGDSATHVVMACSLWVASAARDAVAGVKCHWACTEDLKKRRWRAPPPGWSTSPDVSVDAGGGAWQTPFKKVEGGSSNEEGDVWSMVLQIPLEGPLRSGGIVFVLNTSGGKWVKEKASGGDFFTPTCTFNTTAATAAALPTGGSDQGGSLPTPVSPPKGDASPTPHDSSADDSRQREKSERSEKDGKRAAERSDQEKEADKVGGELAPFISSFQPKEYPPEALLVEDQQDTLLFGMMKTPTSACRWMVDAIAGREPGCERSLMHRYDTANELLSQAIAAPEADAQWALVALVVWLRFSATRQLVWNKNYNIKPREISAAQDRLNVQLAHLFEHKLALRSLVLMAMTAVGRGGQGDVGQRIRDDILSIQSRNNCKGGMMEEWHQKLHNNTSPDDVVICEALLAYMDEGLNIKAYWRVLQASGITTKRLASYDRAIRSEPKFSGQQVAGLTRDLQEYLLTLRAVHSGADLGSAAANVMGYSSTSLKGKTVTVEPIQAVATFELKRLLSCILFLQTNPAQLKKLAGSSVGAIVLFLNLVVEARHLLRPSILAGEAACGDRLRDIIFLDLALDSAGRTALEGGIGDVRACAQLLLLDSTPTGAFPLSAEETAVGSLSDRFSLLLSLLKASAEHVAFSQHSGNVDLVMTAKYLGNMMDMTEPSQQKDRAMQAIAVVDRLKRSLSETASAQFSTLQPTAVALGEALHVPAPNIAIFSEEAVRGTSAAPLAQLLSVLEPSLRRMIGAGDWQVISRGTEKPVEGVVRVESSLASVQYERCSTPTVLVIDHITGHEEVPANVVVVLTSSDCPDILSHSAVRARNMGVIMAACFDEKVMADIKAMEGQLVVVALSGTKVTINKKD